MSWQLLVALSILLYSINGLLHRVLMKNESSDPYAQTVVFSALIGIFTFIILLFRGGIHPFFSSDQLFLFFLAVCITTMATVCAFKGMKLIEASEHTILLTTSKVWLMGGVLLFLHEAFSIWKFIGGMTIVLGVCIAQWRKKKFVFNNGALYVLLAAFLYASAEIISFYILRSFDAGSFIMYSCFVTTIVLVTMRPAVLKKISFYSQPKRAVNIIIVSFNDALATLFVYLAYQVGRNAFQIGPLMATQTIVTVLMAIIFLREKDNLTQKIIGAATVMIGAIILLR